MTLIPEQFSKSGGLGSSGAEAGAYLQLDPPIGSADWILVRGRVVIPNAAPVRRWWPGRRVAQYSAEMNGVTLEVRLPDDEPRPLAVAADGSFETRFAYSLPRLRSAQRQIVFSLRYRNTRVEQPASLFTPQPSGSLGIIVLRPVPVAQYNGSSATNGDLGMSAVSRELVSLLTEQANRTQPIFYLIPQNGRIGATGREPGWPLGLAIPLPASTASSAIAAEQAGWISRLTELFGGELEFAVVADTDPQAVAALRALVRQDKSLRGLRAVFLSDTRPVARGVKLQADRPNGIDGLELPIVVCGTLRDARKAAGF
jgi:hypothetical protein